MEKNKITTSDRIRFVVNTSAEFFNASCSQEDVNIKEFFENDEITVLAATRHETKIQFHHRIPAADESCLLFYKVPQVGSSQPSGHPLGLLTLEGGMVKSIYNSVSRVFSPHVSKRSEYGQELSGLLENLHVSLGTTLGLPQTGITCIQDEINFWKQKSANSSTKSDREQAQMFATILEKINKQIRQIDQTSPSSIEEFLDSAHNNLDEIWRLPYHYPQNRMADLMDVICSQIIETCVENLSTEDVWNLSSYHVNNLMNQVLDITESWLNLCDSLTRLFWPNYAQHPWIGKPHAPRKGQTFKERLAEIKNIKNLYKQIMTLLEDQDLREMFSWNSPFKVINIFDTSSIGQVKWNKALNQFEQLLQPIDERIALAIKSQLHNFLNNPRQVIFIFSKYDTLIQRPTVLELLTTEREQFLQSLHLLLADLKKAMSDTNMEPDAGHLSTICNECRWLKVVQHQIKEIEKVSHLINGREGFEKVNHALQELKEETETLLKTNFEIWSDQSLSSIKSGELKLHEDQNVVQFEKEGRQLMRVTFNPKLVTFCQDVREFENLGFRVSIEMRSSASHASKFMSYARRLQQIATFHNTIGDRMIPCQRPIMLKNAVELSKLVQSESVAWNDEESVKRYVSTLQVAVNRLSNDNNLLVGYHEQAKRTVVKLMNTDLLTQGQTWKDEMRHLRELVATLESQGYTNLDAFKLHWDHQLYKVLEYQYILGLTDMNNKLPDIQIDIVFRQRQLQFRPSEEEIRSKYFTQLRRFIERPLGFRGLSDKSGDLFKIMVSRNRHHFGPLFYRAEELFKKLEELKNLWLPWVALGCIDIDELCNVHLNKWEDWDSNFKACKHFSQQVAKIQNSEECIDCFLINILPLRTDIEFISRRYWEALANSLRLSILNDVSVIQEFVQSALQFLQNVPMDESEIAESGAKYEKINRDLPKISAVLDSVKGKDTCLAGWCKERVSALTGLLIQWEKLQPLIENHSVVLQRQVDIMREHVTSQTINLKDEAEKFLIRWESTIAELEANDGSSLDLFKERQQHWKTIKEKRDKLFEESGKFNMEFPAEVETIFKNIEDKVNSTGQQWELYKEFLSELEEVAKEEWTVYRRRPYILTEVLSKWESSANSSLDQAASRIRQSVENYQGALPVLQVLQSDALTERHWAKIFQILNKSPKPFHTITLMDILNESSLLIQNSGEIQNLVRQASSEQIVRQALTELDQWGVTATLKLTNHTDSGGNFVSLIKDFQEVLNKVGDNQSLLQSAKNSAAFDAFSDQAEIWESRLTTIDNIITSLNQCQRKWVYLEPVFGAGTLKNEEALFKRIDKDFRYIMKEIQNDPRVLSLTKINNVTTVISSLENNLSRCQNTLMSYITSKRNSFPRFYFLSDDDLLEILGQASKEEILQKHIRKLFPGIHSLGLERTSTENKIKKIFSAEGDSISLSTYIDMTGPIEDWLSKLVISIYNTLKEQIQQCSGIQELNDEAIAKYPTQVICTARAINFTRQVEKAISSMSLPTILTNLKKEVTKFANLKNKTRNNLLRMKIRDLLLDLVHYVTTVEHLIENSVTNHGDWNWLKQMKFYINQESQVIIKMVFAEFNYSYEFLGNPNKLVHTTLTHKCYLTLTQAMHLGLGGNPFGPAGTGKTECVKALGGMMGRLVLVFNCDENVDTEAMGLILTGLARCGAWGCFDEFNRLQEATLSAISMLIQPMQVALKEKLSTVEILNEPIQLNQHCGIFVTLNPAGEEYGGRQQLPGNIQALFRPIVMQQPEPREIAQVMLFVEGFQQANVIGERIVELFDLIGRMLSSQRHYDWGLRELKTVLVACGKLLRERGESANEMSLIVEALKSNTMSKLNSSDCDRFDMLLANVFPEVTIEDKSASKLRSAVEDAFSTLGLLSNSKQIEKCLQLYEQLTKRMGVVLVGPPTSGKTTIISVLKQALIAKSNTIRSYTISPKSMGRAQLLGKLDPDTRQWTDGVLTTTAITVNSESLNVTSWIICDGDVDPEWIEALNSVLDDNKLLTLPSGWRIQFGDNVNFIFETHDLSFASPATISRMGIINLSTEDLDKNIIIESWLSKLQEGELLRAFINNYLHLALEWIEKEAANPLSISKLCHVRAALEFISNSQTKDEFCVCLIQGLLGFVINEKHNTFANKIYEITNIYISDPSKAENSYFNRSRDTIETYETDTNQDIIDNSESILILTGQVKTYLDIIRNYLQSECTPFIISGPSGAGKTLLLQQAITEFHGYQLVIINCSAQLTPNYILYTLKQNCITVSGVKGREYKPQQSRILLFLKNIDLCFIDSWGTSDVIELLLQLIQRNGFFAETLEWTSISGLQVCASMSDYPKQDLSPRYLSINNFLRVRYPAENDMRVIVESQLKPILDGFKKVPNMQLVINAVIQLFTQVQETFTQDRHNHYNFTPKMITNLLEGLKNYPGERFLEGLITESDSIFKNRLSSEEELQEYNEILRDCMQSLGAGHEIQNFYTPKGPNTTLLNCTTREEWRDVVQKNITICNSESFNIEDPITNELLEETAKISRLLTRPGSHIILVGQAGCRRMDSLYIATTFLSAKIHLPHGIRNYNTNDFYIDLKLAMQSAALDGQTTSLIIDHSWITFLPEIMKPIEAILQGSEILDLFGDDLESIASPLKPTAQLEGYQESLASYFLKRVKKNLHIILFLDAASNTLSDIFNTYPSLYRSCDLIWMQMPSSDTLTTLPKSIIRSLSTEKEDIPIPTYSMQVLPQKNSNSPRRYYQLLKSYYEIFKLFGSNTSRQLEKLKLGVEKLSSAHEVVGTLKANAGQQEEALAEKRKLASDALEMISATMRNANDQKSDLLQLKGKTQESSEKLMERKKAIELELQDVEPVLQEATAAVGQIKSEALSEIRSLRAPPETIRDILEGVLRLMGIRDTSWNSMKTFLAKRGVKEDIRSLDPSRISPENCDSVERLLRTKSDSFDIRNAKRASAAAAPLASWVIANVRYCKVIQSIKPLEKEQNELQRNLDMAEGQMKSLMTGLDDVDARVKELSGQLNTYTQEAAVLELKLEEARNVLKSAEILVEKLSSEFENWSKQLDELHKTNETLDTKSFLVSVAINYFSDLLHEERRSVINNIASSLHRPNFNISKNLVTEQEQIIWESMGLNKDVQAIENAALLTKIIELSFGTCPIPLIVDPSESAATWLREYLQINKLSYEIISQNSEKFTYNLELSIRFGKILVVQDCQEIQPPLLQLIYTRIYSKFNKKLIQVGNKYIDLHENFKLVLFTKLNKINVAAEISSYMAIIPFTITTAGLTDQLMSKAILLRRPELEEKRINLLKSEGNLLKQRIDLQDKLLGELSSAQGDILKNEKLLQTLNEVKKSSMSIDMSLQESAEIKASLLTEYDQFKSLCSNASNFYMGLLNLYNISVSAFTKLFLKSIKATENSSTDKTYSHLVRSASQYICRSIPKSEHLTLGMFVCRNAFPEQVSDTEWELFVTNFMLGDDTLGDNCPTWIKKELIPKVLAIKLHLPNIYQSLNLDNEDLWKPFINSSTKAQIPVEISPFQKVLISQIFRPDVLSNTMHGMIATMIGIKPGSIIQPSIEQLADETINSEPILMITNSGNDPSGAISDAASKKFGKDMFIELSIGKGIERSAIERIRKAAEAGMWICIKNVHLVPNWITILDRELESLKPKESFRIWLICDSAKGFPIGFTYKCSKILCESPDGVKNKVIRLIQQSSTVIASQKKDPKIVKLHIVLFILHSVLQERRNYIPQGWTKWYEFGDSDLRAAVDFLKWLDRGFGAQKFEWLILQGLCEHISYGGRINDSHDLKILLKHLEEFFNDTTMTSRWSPLHWKVNIPTSATIHDYYDVIQQLPDVDPPDSFGLSPSSNVLRDIAICRNVLITLRSAHFHSEELSNVDKRVRPILSLWKKLSGQSTLLQTINQIQETESNNPWKVFLLSELKLAGQLFNDIHKTLVNLHSAVKELKSISHQDQQLVNTIAENQVPITWKKIWSGPKSTTDYLKSVVSKSIETERRYKSELHLDFTDEINFASIFNPLSFLSALKLKNAQVLKKSACDLILQSSTSEISGQFTVKVSPLLVDGAFFKNRKLTIFDNDKSSILNTSPEFYITFLEKQKTLAGSIGYVELPVYSNNSREKMICNISVASNETADAILFSGVALIVPDLILS